MTRFLMSLEEAVELVLHALAVGNPGEVFVQKAPGVTIGDLARAVLDLFESDAGVREIGIRHGEKLHETLLTRDEYTRSDQGEKYFRVRPDTRDLNYDQYYTDGDAVVGDADDYTSANTERLDVPKIRELLLGQPFVRRALELRQAP